jgi:hypothetical protein
LTTPTRRVRVTFAVLMLVAVAAPAHAFRCGPRIITSGDHADEVLRYCGQPVSVQTRIMQLPQVRDWRQYRGSIEEVVVEEWVYNLGPRQLMRVVRLENGFVAEVKSLGYGY